MLTTTTTTTTYDCSRCDRPCTPDGVGTGYARMPDGKTLCYGCADETQRADMLGSTKFTAYLGPGDHTITTWSGGVLGSVLTLTRTRTQTWITARDVHGQVWRGCGPAESGTYVSLWRS